MATCATTPTGRRTLFWATQPDACGTDTVCRTTCGEAGLAFTGTTAARSISTDNWLQGLIINMLLTDGKQPDTACGYSPGSQGGHWSESYMKSNKVVGTLLRDINPAGRVADLTILLQQYATITLQRLIARGVALSVDAKVEYVGDGKFNLNVTVTGVSNEVSNVGISGERLNNGWVWQ